MVPEEEDRILTEEDFNKKYHFNNMQRVTVLNPMTKDYKFQMMTEVGVDMMTGQLKSEPRIYMVKAGGSERYPGVIANMYLDQVSKLIAQDRGNFGMIADPMSRAKLYDELIGGVEDALANSFYSFEEADKAKDQPAEEKEEAFAGLKRGPGRPAKEV